MNNNEQTYFTMRSAYKRWAILHHESSRFAGGFTRIPYWFRYYIRNNANWTYFVTNKNDQKKCNKAHLTDDECRVYRGHYAIYISDAELLNLRCPDWKPICQ